MNSIFEMDDTIAAVSTAVLAPGAAGRTIIRISGPEAFKMTTSLLSRPARLVRNRLTHCRLRIEEELDLAGVIYCFAEPHSYTGQDLCEVHIEAAAPAIEPLMEQVYKKARPAGPGEFTQRAYLNGKLDLTQAEAVAQIISSANAAQLDAAQRLLAGRFSETIGAIRDGMLDLLGRLEAGLDFTEEDIEFVSGGQARAAIAGFKTRIEGLLNGSIRCERMIDLDSVGLAGLPNAGKSSLLNALLGRQRSIVSEQEATTRDVLTGVLELQHLDAVLFDCAGLMPSERQTTPIDRLSHNASLQALSAAAVVVFCVDAAKENISADAEMRRQITAGQVICAATKTDLLTHAERPGRLEKLNSAFGQEFLATSAQTGEGLEALKDRIETTLLARRSNDTERQDRLAINERHRRRLQEAVKAMDDCAEEIDNEAEEVAAMFLRQAYEVLGGLEHEDIDESILERIFSRFCIGK